MKVDILQENLLQALTKTQRIAGGKTQLPILTYLLLSAKENKLNVVATNLEITIRVSVGVKTEEEGEICIPAKTITELVNTLPKEKITLSSETEKLTIFGGRTKAMIPGVLATEFPPVPEIQEHNEIDLDKELLMEVLSGVLFSAATDEARPLLTGIRIEKNPEGTIFVATDGYRLSIKTISGFSLLEEALVIPARALLEVLRMSQEEKEVKTVRLTETVEGQLQFTIGGTSVCTRRIEGEYPNYRRIIPAAFATRAVIDAEELVRAVKSAAIFARDNSGIIKFTIAADGIVISANTPQVGENTIEIDATVEGEGGVVAMNSRFLLDFLNNFSGEQLVLEMTGAINPVVSKNPKDETFLHIIMPVRVQS